MANKRLMLAFPHPDDESFGPGGTIAKYAREGTEVHYVCATRGEVGTVEAELIKPYEHLPADQRLGALTDGLAVQVSYAMFRHNKADMVTAGHHTCARL